MTDAEKVEKILAMLRTEHERALVGRDRASDATRDMFEFAAVTLFYVVGQAEVIAWLPSETEETKCPQS
jgi:hypothetical protein